MEILNLYEIFVPVCDNKQNVYDLDFHHEWDKKILKISNGLTILRSQKGSWLSQEGEIYKEEVIPIRIAATHEQILQIMDITAEHYSQKAMFCRHIPGEVYLKKYENLSKK